MLCKIMDLYRSMQMIEFKTGVKFQQTGVQQFGAKSWVYLKPNSHQITRNKQFSRPLLQNTRKI